MQTANLELHILYTTQYMCTVVLGDCAPELNFVISQSCKLHYYNFNTFEWLSAPLDIISQSKYAPRRQGTHIINYLWAGVCFLLNHSTETLGFCNILNRDFVTNSFSFMCLWVLMFGKCFQVHLLEFWSFAIKVVFLIKRSNRTNNWQ